MPRFDRSQLLQTFRAKIAKAEPIIGGGAGTGLSAKCEEAGGIDLIVIYNSGRYRMAGRGSLAGLLAYGNGTDPFLILDDFLHRLRELGFSGVQNFPTVGIIDGQFRQNLEETGMGFSHEVDMIHAAHEHDLLTTPYVFNEREAIAMAEAGADIIVCHMGLTTGGSIGAETGLKLADCPPLIKAWSAAARQVDKDIIVLCHGGPIATPEDARFILAQ